MHPEDGLIEYGTVITFIILQGYLLLVAPSLEHIREVQASILRGYEQHHGYPLYRQDLLQPLARQLAIPTSARLLEIPRIPPLRGMLLQIKQNLVLKSSNP